MISILLATYNGEKYIKESIDSIINQTYKDFELLIGFNGTTDGSKKIVSEYNDDRIRVFDYGDDKGKSITLNKLLKEAKYDWCAMQDDDDIWLETKLEKQLEYTKDFDIIGTFIYYLENGVTRDGPNLSQYDGDIKRKSFGGDNQIANSSAIFKKRDAISINGWVDDGLEDFDFWLKLMRVGKEFVNIPEKLVLHRLHSDSNFNTKRNLYDLKKIL